MVVLTVPKNIEAIGAVESCVEETICLPEGHRWLQPVPRRLEYGVRRRDEHYLSLHR
jgi:hypothetical protein